MPSGVAALPPNSRVLLWVHFCIRKARGQCRPRASFVPLFVAEQLVLRLVHNPFGLADR